MVAVMPGDDGDAQTLGSSFSLTDSHTHAHTLSPSHSNTHSHTHTPSHIHTHTVRLTKEQDAHMGFPASSNFIHIY